MAATYMLRKHLACLNAASRCSAIKERQASKQAHEKALAAMKEKYPVLSADNFEEADLYRKSRVAYYLTRKELNYESN